MKLASDSYKDASDDALLVLYGNGDPAAAAHLTRRLVPRLVPYCARLLGGDRAEAEDVCQESMLRLWKISSDWRSGEAKVSTWLFKIASNLCIDRIRKRRTVNIDTISEPEDGKPSVLDTMIQSDRAFALQNALNSLPERQRIAVTLRHIEGLANPEIAQILQISTEAVESLTARGKKTLAQALSGQKKELGYV